MHSTSPHAPPQGQRGRNDMVPVGPHAHTHIRSPHHASPPQTLQQTWAPRSKRSPPVRSSFRARPTTIRAARPPSGTGPKGWCRATVSPSRRAPRSTPGAATTSTFSSSTPSPSPDCATSCRYVLEYPFPSQPRFVPHCPARAFRWHARTSSAFGSHIQTYFLTAIHGNVAISLSLSVSLSVSLSLSRSLPRSLALLLPPLPSFSSIYDNVAISLISLPPSLPFVPGKRTCSSNPSRASPG